MVLKSHYHAKCPENQAGNIVLKNKKKNYHVYCPKNMGLIYISQKNTVKPWYFLLFFSAHTSVLMITPLPNMQCLNQSAFI